MGKGTRARAQRAESRQDAQNILEKPEVRRAMNREINDQLKDAHKRFIQDETAVILWALHATFGFGAHRLRKFYDEYGRQWRALLDFYEASDTDAAYLAAEQLKRIGVDLDAWQAEK